MKNIKQISKQFIITVPSNVLFMSKPTQLALYVAIRSFAGNGRGICYASKSEIATRAKVHRDTVYRQIKFLKQAGFVRSIGRKVRSIGGKPVEHLAIVDNDMPPPEKQDTQSNIPVSGNEGSEYADTEGTESVKVNQKEKQTNSGVNSAAGETSFKKGMESLRDVLASRDLLSLSGSSNKHEWQFEAERVGKKLGVKYEENNNWFRFFKRAYGNGFSGLIKRCESFCADYENPRDIESVFYSTFHRMREEYESTK